MSDRDTIAELRAELTALKAKTRHDLALLVNKVAEMTSETSTRLDARLDAATEALSAVKKDVEAVQVDVEDLKGRVPPRTVDPTTVDPPGRP